MNLENLILLAVVLGAIELYRRLRRMEYQVDMLLRQTGLIGDDRAPSAEVAALAARGDEIEAMRLYRQQSGADVRRARDVVRGLARGLWPGAEV